MATAMSESTSGQSDAHQDKGVTATVDSSILPSGIEQDNYNGHGKATNDIPAPEGDKAGEIIEGGIQLGPEPGPKKKKKKNKSKKTGAASRKNVTGFEEFYADVPMTPAQSSEEKQKIYCLSRPFPDRIEECIQRYRASRRMNPERTMLFSKYMWLGGIDASQRQFTGASKDQEALAEANADEIRTMTAIDFVGGNGRRFYEPSESENWFVDFEGIVKGFLSRVIPNIYMYDETANQLAADLVKNFLNYVLAHDACPEYTDEIEAAKRICDAAPIELRMMHELLHELPGTFNSIANSLFCDGQINKIDDETYNKLVVFRVTVLTSEIDVMIKKKLMSSNDPTIVSVIDTKEQTYQVVETIQPCEEDILMVEAHLKAAGHPGKGKPAGILKLKPSIIDHGYNNVPHADEFDLRSSVVEEYLLESDLLVKFDKGMKIKADVCELNIGLRFIKKIKDIRVSFDLFLPQMLMEHWKDPVPNERPPPSASKPNVEENDMADEI
ncbi:Argonaute siRNA chaperone complex subunit Arb1-domain-containing protein [Jackrogersella minutella]|nr:Argonaute siRNA chaperone complex subunit Arb1-domain-containing protein [Jackrogersella minutella]